MKPGKLVPLSRAISQFSSQGFITNITEKFLIAFIQLANQSSHGGIEVDKKAAMYIIKKTLKY